MKALLYENEIVEKFRSELSKADKFHFAFALLSKNGLLEIEDALLRCLDSGGQGRVLIGADMPTDPEAIRYLRELESDYGEQLELRRFQSGKRHVFHTKLAIFESNRKGQTAVLGSSNLTHGGLIANYEANVLVNEKTVVRALLDYFDEYFLGAYARRIDDLWFSNYLRWWTERKKAEKKLQKIREKVRKLPAKRMLPKALPKRIKDEVFAFTGKIEDWPREAKLYPTVRKLRGRIATAAKSIKSAACLVHGEILLGKKTTNKLRGARQYGIPIISEDEFFQILSHEKRLRGKG